MACRSEGEGQLPVIVKRRKETADAIANVSGMRVTDGRPGKLPPPANRASHGPAAAVPTEAIGHKDPGGKPGKKVGGSAKNAEVRREPMELAKHATGRSDAERLTAGPAAKSVGVGAPSSSGKARGDAPAAASADDHNLQSGRSGPVASFSAPGSVPVAVPAAENPTWFATVQISEADGGRPAVTPAEDGLSQPVMSGAEEENPPAAAPVADAPQAAASAEEGSNVPAAAPLVAAPAKSIIAVRWNPSVQVGGNDCTQPPNGRMTFVICYNFCLLFLYSTKSFFEVRSSAVLSLTATTKMQFLCFAGLSQEFVARRREFHAQRSTAAATSSIPTVPYPAAPRQTQPSTGEDRKRSRAESSESGAER